MISSASAEGYLLPEANPWQWWVWVMKNVLDLEAGRGSCHSDFFFFSFGFAFVGLAGWLSHNFACCGERDF